jgi:hypothetical protein
MLSHLIICTICDSFEEFGVREMTRIAAAILALDFTV